VGIAIIFLVVSYLLSLLSFYLYTKLSQILQPVEKGFWGFAIIGLIAGLIAVLVSFLNKRLIPTIVISFGVDCLVDSVILYSKLGTQVIQYLPGLLISMSSVIVSWHFLKRKPWLPKNSTQGTKEQFNSKYALARKLFKNPNKITLEALKEVSGALQGINPKIDALLKEADSFSRALSGDVLGFIVAHIRTEKEEDEEKKEKVLFFIDLVNDIWEEVNAAYVRLNAGNSGNYADHPVRQLGNSMIASSGPSGFATISMAIVVATSVAATNTADIGSMLPKNDFLAPETQNSQEVNVPTQTETPKNSPTDIPKTVPILTYSAVEKTIFVSALEEGITYTAGSTGTYRFTITGGAYMADPAKGWEAKVMIYKNRPIDWSGPNGTHTNWNYLVGYPDVKSTREEAEQLGKGQHLDIFLDKDEYLIFIVFDSKDDFVNNSGGIYVQVQKGAVTTQTVSPALAAPAIQVDSGWAHFWRSFNGPPGPDTTSTIDYSGMAMYVTVHNNGTAGDRIIGGASSYCTSITFDDISIYGPDGTISGIDVPAKSTVVMDFMKASRIICNGTKEGLKQGDRITMSLIFEKFGQVPAWVEIRETPE